MIRDEPCVKTYRAAVEEFVHLEVVTPESQSTLSGSAGFAVAPIAYKRGEKGFLLDAGDVKIDSPRYLVKLLGDAKMLGDAKKRAENGRIRIVVTDSTNSIYSEPSAPITFSMPDGVYSNVDSKVKKLLNGGSLQASPSPSPSPSPGDQYVDRYRSLLDTSGFLDVEGQPEIASSPAGGGPEADVNPASPLPSSSSEARVRRGRWGERLAEEKGTASAPPCSWRHVHQAGPGRVAGSTRLRLCDA